MPHAPPAGLPPPPLPAVVHTINSLLLPFDKNEIKGGAGAGPETTDSAGDAAADGTTDSGAVDAADIQAGAAGAETLLAAATAANLSTVASLVEVRGAGRSPVQAPGRRLCCLAGSLNRQPAQQTLGPPSMGWGLPPACCRCVLPTGPFVHAAGEAGQGAGQPGLGRHRFPPHQRRDCQRPGRCRRPGCALPARLQQAPRLCSARGCRWRLDRPPLPRDPPLRAPWRRPGARCPPAAAAGVIPSAELAKEILVSLFVCLVFAAPCPAPAPPGLLRACGEARCVLPLRRGCAACHLAPHSRAPCPPLPPAPPAAEPCGE